VVPLGFAGGEAPTIPANILLVKNLTVIGIYMGYYKLKERKRYCSRIRALFELLTGWFEEGRISPVVSDAFPLERIGDAFATVLARDKTGHVAIVMDEEARRLGVAQ
jgi:NADPH2:quinone reductase